MTEAEWWGSDNVYGMLLVVRQSQRFSWHKRAMLTDGIRENPLTAQLLDSGVPLPEKGKEALAVLVRELFGNPFRSVEVDPYWRDANVLPLAQAIYDDRTFDYLPILADALEDAGCHDADILAHCRGPGPHVRGCWVVDLLTGRQ